MAARRTPPPQKGAFYPTSDVATHRDLLRFEERLKTNAAILKRRKSRYQVFLVQLLAAICFLLSETFLQTSFMALSYKFVLRKSLPHAYSEDFDVQLHPYFAKGLLLVAVTTLILFFASGLYEEKIGYANRYVPHANRALRNFNMHLNVRHRPLRSRLLVNPFSFLSHRNSPEEPAAESRRSPSPDRRPKRGTSVPIPPIPPTSNPRGELIFSSRVDHAFRESYERFRAAFERKREEREQYAAAQTFFGWKLWPWNWFRSRATASPPTWRGHSPSNSALSRGRATDTDSTASTPASSRRPSPVPASIRRRKGNVGGNRSGTPPGAVPSRLLPD